MTLSKPVAAAALCVLLIGCSKGGGAASGGGQASAPASTPAAAPASGPDVAIDPAQLPHVKAGYWERVENTDAGAPSTTQFCSSGKPLSAPPQLAKGCSKFSFKRTFTGGFVIDAACVQGPMKTDFHLVASGDFNSSYVTDSKVTLTMQGRPPTSFTGHSVTHYVGACPAGVASED